MRKCMFILIFMPLLGIAQTNGFIINGNLSGLKNNEVVSITDANNPTDTIATAAVASEKFVLKGKVSEPGLYHLNLSGLQKKALLFLDNSTVSVSGKSDDIQKLSVTGSASHKDFLEFQDVFNPLFSELSKLGEQIKSTGMNDSIKARSTVILGDVQKAVDRYIGERKNSYVAPFLLLVTSQLSEDQALLESRFKGLATNVQEGFYGKIVSEQLSQGKERSVRSMVGSVGSMAIDFTQNDINGKPVTLSSFKGKYVLVDFWASWCGPCRRENPNVVNTYNAFKNKNFTVLGVSLDRSREPWLKAISDDGLTWTHVSDLKFWSNEAAQKYNIASIPSNLLVDPNGKIIARDLYGDMLTQKLSEILK